MAFTNNRNVFYNNKSFDEKLFANGLGMGTPSFVCKGLELTGTTLTSGVFNNTGAFGILGLEGETHTIPANYTGFIVIKTTMNSQNGFNEIITSATKLDTDQRDTSNIKHFTIYELLNGVIVQDFRHINYVKSFFLKNMGGSNIAWVLNGFTSETFDASVLAGNRTFINDEDIAYDDTTHGATSTNDNYKDLFDKAQLNVGEDKNFILSFAISSLYNPNLFSKTITLISDKYGLLIPNSAVLNFKMEATTVNGLNGESLASVNTITVSNKHFFFEFEYDFDAFADVLIRDGRRSPHQDVMCEFGSYMRLEHAFNLDVKYRDYISGMTFWIADFDSVSGKWNTSDARPHYVPRTLPKTPPTGASDGNNGDLLLSGLLSFMGSKRSDVNPIAITDIVNMYLSVSYGEVGQTYPDGINVEGLLTASDNDQVLAMVTVHYGEFNWDDTDVRLSYVNKAAYTPSLLNQPINNPEVGDNMEETSILKEVLDNA